MLLDAGVESGLLPFPEMQTDDRLRQRVLSVLNKGVSHKVVASKMGMTPSTFSKWLNKRTGSGAATLDHLDGFEAFLRELREVVEPTTNSPDDEGPSVRTGQVRKAHAGEKERTTAVSSSEQFSVRRRRRARTPK